MIKRLQHGCFDLGYVCRATSVGQASTSSLLKLTSSSFYVSPFFLNIFFKAKHLYCAVACSEFLDRFVSDAIMSVGMILLNEKFEIFKEYKFQKYAPMVGLALVVIDFGYLLSIFRMKYQGYPYRFVVY